MTPLKWIRILTAVFVPALAHANPCPSGFALIAKQASLISLASQNRSTLLKSGFVQKQQSQIFEGHGFLVRLLENGTPVVYRSSKADSTYWGIGTTFKKVEYGGKSWDENSVDFYSTQNGQTRVDSILTGEEMNSPVSAESAAARRSQAIEDQIAESGIAAEPLTANTVFTTEGRTDLPPLIVIKKDKSVDLYRPVDLRRNSGFHLNFNGASIVGLRDNGLEINDGIVSTVLGKNGFVKSRRIEQDIGAHIETAVQNGYTPSLLEKPHPVPELAFKEGLALAGPTNASIAPLESRTTELRELLDRSAWAKGSKGFTGNMLNAPFISPQSNLKQIIANDEARVANIGQTHQKIGTLLAVMRGLSSKVDRFQWGTRTFNVVKPGKGVLKITDLATQETLMFRVEHPELIYQYGFYGDPETASRVDPETIVRFFNLKK